MFACYCGSRKGNTKLINIKIHPFVLLLMQWSIMDEDVVWWDGPKGCSRNTQSSIVEQTEKINWSFPDLKDDGKVAISVPPIEKASIKRIRKEVGTDSVL